MSQQIDLVFGVAGGGSPSGESGAKIQRQINNIIGHVNKNMPMLKLKVNYKAVTDASRQLKNLKSQIDSINSKPIKITSTGAGVIGNNTGGERIASESAMLYKQVQKIAHGLPEAEAKVLGFNQSLAQTKNAAQALGDVRAKLVPLLNGDGLLQPYKEASKNVGALNGVVQAYDSYTKAIKLASVAEKSHSAVQRDVNSAIKMLHSSLKSQASAISKNKIKLLDMDASIPEVEKAKQLIESLERRLAQFKTTAGTMPVSFLSNTKNAEAAKAFLASSDLQKMPAMMSAAKKASKEYGDSIRNLGSMAKTAQKSLNGLAKAEEQLQRFLKTKKQVSVKGTSSGTTSFATNLKEVKELEATIARMKTLSSSISKNGKIIDTASMSPAQLKNLRKYVQLYEMLPAKINAAAVATGNIKTQNREIMSGAKAVDQIWSAYNKMSGTEWHPDIKAKYMEMLDKYRKKARLTADEVVKFRTELNQLNDEAYQKGANKKGFLQLLDTKLMDQIRHMITAFATMVVTQGFRMVYQNILELDTAMTELKKVTDETDEAYDRFLTNASQRAKNLGASLVEVVNITADYARLGYSVDEASALADAAIVYTNVGDGLSGTDEATDHLISTMKAFHIETENSMRIVDAFNEVSNNFAVTSSDIGAGLQRSSAAMAAAGNSMEETIALFTAGNTIIRDADSMGTSLKTMSMRLRSTKTDLESMGEDTDGAAESVSSLRKEIKALTGVDIMKNNTTYKNTYEILQDISKEWEHLNDITQANVLELLFGKRQANVGAAIIENFDIAEDVLETAKNSAGSAMEENEKYLQSIQGHLDQLSASFQEFANNFLDSEWIKFFLDALRTIVEFFNSIIVTGEKVAGTFGEIAGSAITLASVLAALDTFWGFKHLKDAIAGIKGMPQVIKTVASTAQAAFSASSKSEATVYRVVDVYRKGTKKAIGTARAVDKEATKLLESIGKVKSAFPAMATAAAVAMAVIIGRIHVANHSASTQIEKMDESIKKYEAVKDTLEEHEKSLESNKERLAELYKIPFKDRTDEINDEIDSLETENTFLEQQIKYYRELEKYKKEETRSDILESMDNTAGNRVVDHQEGVLFQILQNSNVDYYDNEYADYMKTTYKKYQDAYNSVLEASWGNEADEYATFEEWNAALGKAKHELEAVKTVYDDLTTNTRGTLTKLFSVMDVEDEAAVEALRELVTMLQTLGLWSDQDTGSLIDLFGFENAISNFDSIKQAIDDAGNTVTVEWAKQAFGAETLNTLLEKLEIAGLSWETFINWCNAADEASQIEGNVKVEISPSTEELEAAKEAIQSFSSACKSMADAFYEQSENGVLSVDTILDVIDAGYAAALVIDQETGAVRLNAEMYKELAQAKITEQTLSLMSQQNSLISSRALLNEAIAANKAAEGYATLAETKAALATVEAQIAAIDAQLVALNAINLSKITQGVYGIGDAASKASSRLSKLQSGMETLLDNTVSWLKQEYSDAQETQEKYYESQIDSLEEAKDAAKERWDAEKEALEEAKDAYNDLIDAQIELLQRQKEADDYEKNKTEKANAVADIENQLLAIENDDSIEAQKMRLELQEQLKEAQDALNELQTDREYELREEALQDEKDRYNDEIEAKLDAIDKQAEAEEKAYEARIDRLQKYLDAVRDSEKTEAQWREEAYDWIENRESELYQSLIEWNRIYGDGRDSTVEQWFKESEGWRAWGDSFSQARDNLARYLYELEKAGGRVAAAITGALKSLEPADILIQLTNLQRQFVEEGDMLMASFVDTVYEAFSQAILGGYEFSNEMLSAMSDAIKQGDLDFLRAVSNMLGYFNNFTETGKIDIAAMGSWFTQVLSSLNENQQAVLQSMYNNILEVTQAAANMQTTMRGGTGSPGGPHGTGQVDKTLKKYSKGGVIDYTGPAAVHGSKARPEVVFNADAAAKLYDYVVNTPDLLKSAFAGMIVDNSALNGVSHINNSPSIGDINISIAGNADADTVLKLKQLASNLRDEVVKSLNDSMNRRGIIRSPRTI